MSVRQQLTKHSVSALLGLLIAVACTGPVAPTPVPTSSPYPTHTPFPTWTPAPTWTPGPVPTPTAAPLPTYTPYPTYTAVPTPTFTPTPTLVPTRTSTPVPTSTPTSVPTPTFTPVPTATATLIPTPTQFSLSAMIRQVRPAVVRISTGTSVGTGFIFQLDSDAAFVLTNHHVVAGYSTPTVRVWDSANFNGAVIGVDSIRDVAVIRICCGDFNALSFAESSNVTAGTEVVNIGYALGLTGEATVSTGIISAVRRDSHRSAQVIQTDAPINPGNSGGPMLSLDGKVLGINTFKYVGTRVEGVGFALSGPFVQTLLPNLLSGRLVPNTPTPVAAPTVTATPDTLTVLYGPRAGELQLKRGLLSFWWANGQHAGDMGMEATFHNPVVVEDWYYGFAFAHDTSSAVLAYITRDGYWAVSRWISGRGHRVEQVGFLPRGALETGANYRNHVKVVLEGDALTFYVNGERAPKDADMSKFEISGGGDFGVFGGGRVPTRPSENDDTALAYEQYQVWKP